MNYHFIEYLGTEMIAGDWRWYLDTYATEPSGMRTWIKDGQLIVQAYRAPDEFKHYVLAHVCFTPPLALRDDRFLPKPKGLRWGIVTCLRKDLVELIGPILRENATLGQLRLRDGTIVRDWVPVIFKHRAAIPGTQPCGPAETAEWLSGEALSHSVRYSMIVRDDIFQVIRGFHFEGCRIGRHAITGNRPGKLL